MKDLARLIAIATVAPLAVWASGARAAEVACVTPPEPVGASPASLAWPVFCDIPVTPTDVRSPTAFNAAVLSTRSTGSGLIARTAPSTFSLMGTEGFEAEARREATPPPPMTTPGEPDTAAFAAAAKAKATPPRRPH